MGGSQKRGQWLVKEGPGFVSEATRLDWISDKNKATLLNKKLGITKGSKNYLDCRGGKI